MASALNFGHDVLDRSALEPAVAVARVVTGPRPIHTKEPSESVQAKLTSQDREGVPLKILIAHLFERDHIATS